MKSMKNIILIIALISSVSTSAPNHIGEFWKCDSAIVHVFFVKINANGTRDTTHNNKKVYYKSDSLYLQHEMGFIGLLFISSDTVEFHQYSTGHMWGNNFYFWKDSIMLLQATMGRFPKRDTVQILLRPNGLSSYREIYHDFGALLPSGGIYKIDDFFTLPSYNDTAASDSIMSASWLCDHFWAERTTFFLSQQPTSVNKQGPAANQTATNIASMRMIGKKVNIILSPSSKPLHDIELFDARGRMVCRVPINGNSKCVTIPFTGKIRYQGFAIFRFNFGGGVEYRKMLID